jgi:Domain of unknown function (DUF4388)
MALEGSIKDFGLSDILQLIYFQRKTGALSLSGHMDKVRLMFHEGSIVEAESRKRLEENRMGKILTKKGLIREDDLRKALEDQKSTGMKLGAVLLKKGLIGQEELREILHSQMTETVYQLFSWKEGSYEFRSQEVAIDREMPFAIDTQQILMEGLRKVDEWSIVEEKITLDTVFKKTGKNDYSATPEEHEVLKHVDGENDVSIIIELSGLDDMQASRAFASLLDQGAIASIKAGPVTAEGVAVPVKTGDVSVLKLISLASIAILALMISLMPFGGNEISRILHSLNRLRSIGNIEELRFMTEVYKYRNGSYPASLDQIGSSTDIWGSPYVYKVESNGVIISSAGPDREIGTRDDIY